MEDRVNGEVHSVPAVLTGGAAGVALKEERFTAPRPEEVAAQLAAAQAERLAAKSAANVAEALGAAPPKAEPKVMHAIAVQLLDNGQVRFNAPLHDPDVCLEMIRVLHVALIQAARAQGAQQGAARAKMPFMRRVFGKRVS